MNVLVICDDIWHPGEVIVRGLKPLEKQGYELDFVMAAKDILTKDMLYNYDVIINAKGNAHSPANSSSPWFEDTVTAVMPNDFKEYIESGRGFIALHSGNTYHPESRKDMVDLIGNSFIRHPKQCNITAHACKDHPIISGIEPFVFRDEHYMIQLYNEEELDIFMETTSDTEAGTQPGGYTKLVGKGRLVVLTPGHNCAVLQHPSFQKILANAIDWAAGKLN